jgi:iron complex outermembrane receptor protein
VVRAALLSIVLAVATVAMPVSAQAIAQSYHLNIPRQQLDGALKDLAQQTGLQIARFSDTPSGSALVGPLSGDMSVDEALISLLKMSGLTYKVVNDRTIAVMLPGADSAAGTSTQASGVDQASPATSDNGKEGKKSSSEQFRVAQLDQGQTSGAATVEQAGEQASKKKTVQLEEVIVTGSHIPTVALQQVQPVQVYRRDEIEQSGQTTLVGFLNNLPDVSTIGNDSLIGVPGASTTVQLHGLPVGTTLVLLNGRRVETNSYADVFDLGNIPVTAIERIEVLPVGASAIYGADALAGAVNIILRSNFNGFEANGKFGHTDGDNDSDANIAWGRNFDRGGVSIIATYDDRGQLLGSQRTPTSSTDFPANAFTSNYVIDACSPGNVYSLNGQNLPGLSSPQAGIPAGISGTPTVQQFAATAGHPNECNYHQDSSLIPASNTEGTYLSGHYEVARSIEFFSEILFTHAALQADDVPLISPSHVTLGANNPYNPFGEAVAVSFSYPGIPSAYDSSKYLIQPLVGVRGSIFSDWHYEATAYLSRDRFHADYLISNSSPAQTAALGSSDPATALNPFTTGVPGTPQLMQSILGSSALIDALFDSRVEEGEALLRGPLLQLPAGPLQLAVGSEYFHLSQLSEQLIPALGVSDQSDLSRNSYAGFLEARIPLLAEQGEPQSGDQLAMTLAGRYDHTNDFGGKATWQGGLLWRPVQSISITGSYGLSYQAPQLVDLGGGVQFTYPQLVSDPLRGGQTSSVTVVYGSNPNLQPETGKSRTLGVAYSSESLKGFTASSSYFDIDITNYIGRIAPLVAVANQNLFSSLIVRGPPSPQDIAKGYPGPILQINQSPFNFGELRVSGFDVDLRYAVDSRAGTFTPSVAIANVFRWQSALLPGSPVIDYVSQATYNGPGFAPRWKGTAAIDWKKSVLSANITGRYLGRYTDYQDFVANTNELGNQWLFDAHVRYQLSDASQGNSRWHAGTYIEVGAVNLLNKMPPFSYGALPWDSMEYDLRGRFVYAQAGVKW